MKRMLLLVGAVVVIAAVAWAEQDYAAPRRRARILQDDVQVARLAVDSCRMGLSRAEAEFRAYDERVDSLRGRVRDYEALRPGGVPVDSFDAYMKTFGRYNASVPGWRARADSLETRWRHCRDLVVAHNQLADSLRGLLVQIGALPDTASSRRGAGAARGTPEDTEVVATPEDWAIVRRKVEWGRAQGLDTLPLGEAVARMGLSFVGTPYRPGTLEVPGPERLVVNLRALDCVTFVETTLALTHLVRAPDVAVPDSADPAGMKKLEDTYRTVLTQIRYRNGVLAGYPSRLHYFSDWIGDAQRKGIVRNVTAQLGGVPDSEAVNFMSRHPGSYPRLSDPAVLGAIEETEERISGTPRFYIPEDRIRDAAPGIHDGDVIAATASTRGLDVAHTGIAYWKGGALHLIHAPLVGDSVHVSVRTLARRVNDIKGQDGIMVARPEGW